MVASRPLKNKTGSQGLRPVQALLKVCNYYITIPQRSASGEVKWEEPIIPDILRPHSVFNSAWKKAEKNMQRVKSGLVDPSYHFPKPILFVNVSMPEQKKTYLINWLSAHLLWISQMWRDFLNTIGTDLPSSMRSASMKPVVYILGENIIHAAQGLAGVPEEIEWQGMQVQVSSLLDPPLWLICSILWELYELNFRYELYALDWIIIPRLWTTNKAQLDCQGLLYSIFPGKYGLLMWLEPLTQEPHELGLCASSMSVALPYWNNFFSSSLDTGSCWLSTVIPTAPLTAISGFSFLFTPQVAK
ncbi:hypothetical protein EDC04DRAFT_2607638 [Pisolithus marmoratus]|nr:hypothetical protein EDC04DRAFT_2607638 [Pisolithus marmoratus]